MGQNAKSENKDQTEYLSYIVFWIGSAML